ncbi:A disintegrin and metalloproteinase with thrombospondin motifs 5-like [Rhincodon typus]|uniref:A disintegrin and metalloproteinase with thrombospondin motifs 5-like n=1 Tax=Rhincodon typus TaxID=259920 RepID=UPI002030DEC2|nr:A disintegrin and metalloproteinase with thrombospondin motifs 5-like [Rhincodon typus]
MPHDSSDICTQVGELPSSNQMMSNLLTRIDYSEPWSKCSSKLSLGFFESGRADCLLNKPEVSLAESAPLAGRNYDANQQCRLTFGPGHRWRPGSDPCRILWCIARHQGEWLHASKQLPAADGTDCGQGRVCMRGECVSNWQQAKPIDGNWGSWGPWGQCSQTCGGGVQFSRRRCDNPLPASFGRYCQGRRDIFQSCNLTPCPDNNGRTYRDEQCEARNRPAPNGQGSYEEWEPYYHGIRETDLCKLNCLLKGTSQVTVFNIKVKDGTRCTPHSDAICVRSRCIKTGCDGIIRSRKRYNKCGTCGGEDSACQRVIRRFRNRTVNYSDVAVIPVGAANFKARQEFRRGQTQLTAYLALKRLNGSYILNGDTQISGFDSLLTVGGVDLRYMGWSPRRDVLRAVTRGALTEPLVLQVYNPSRQRVVQVLYSYYVPKEQANNGKPTRMPTATLTSYGALPNPTLTECTMTNVTTPTTTLPTHMPAPVLTTRIDKDTLVTLGCPVTPTHHTTAKGIVPSRRPTLSVPNRRPTLTVPIHRPTPTVRRHGTTPKMPTRRPTPRVPSRRTTPRVPSRRTTPTVPSRRTTPTVPSRRTTPTVPSRRTTPTVPSRRTTPTVPSHRNTPTMPSHTSAPTLSSRSITKATQYYGQPGKREPSRGLHNATLPTPKRHTHSFYRPPRPTRIRLNPQPSRTKASSTSWHPGPWQSCSVTCGVGWRVRWLRCLDRHGVLSAGCDYRAKPAGMALCVMQKC